MNDGGRGILGNGKGEHGVGDIGVSGIPLPSIVPLLSRLSRLVNPMSQLSFGMGLDAGEMVASLQQSWSRSSHSHGCGEGVMTQISWVEDVEEREGEGAEERP